MICRRSGPPAISTNIRSLFVQLRTIAQRSADGIIFCGNRNFVFGFLSIFGNITALRPPGAVSARREKRVWKRSFRCRQFCRRMPLKINSILLNTGVYYNEKIDEEGDLGICHRSARMEPSVRPDHELGRLFLPAFGRVRGLRSDTLHSAGQGHIRRPDHHRRHLRIRPDLGRSHGSMDRQHVR